MQQHFLDTNPTSAWKAFIGSYFFVCFFSITFIALTAASGLTSLSPLKYVLVYSLVWMLLPLWMPRITRPWLWGVGFICWASSLLKLGYFAIYRQEMSQSVFFTLIESNPAEGSEFFGNYFRWWMAPAVLVYSAAAIALGRHVRPFTMGPRTRLAITAVVVLTFAEPVVTYWQGANATTAARALRKIGDRHAGIEPWQTAVSYMRYRNELAEVQHMLQTMQTQPQIAIIQRDRHEQQTYVLVIGESTNRQRMSLYGYARKTTPKLDAMRDQLIAFDDVIATRPYTIESLRQALALGDDLDPGLVPSRPNIISLMKRAGFKTFWITNQQTISSRNTMLTAYSQMADEKIYLNNNRVQSSSHYDDVVLEPFSKAMADVARKKFIIVHLLGTHIGYQHRYPEWFEVFRQFNADSVLNKKQRALFNHYDNAVAYNDFIVSEIVMRYQSTSPYGALVYFSDHGEEVFDFRTFQGRDENDPSPQMYTVPFIVAPSERWSTENADRVAQMRAATSTPFSLAHFMHAWCDLVTIETQECHNERSLFSSNFVATPRLIGDPANPKSLRDYDADVASIGAGTDKFLVVDSQAAASRPPRKTIHNDNKINAALGAQTTIQ